MASSLSRAVSAARIALCVVSNGQPADRTFEKTLEHSSSFQNSPDQTPLICANLQCLGFRVQSPVFRV